MLREIKFRGKRVDNNEWVYGYYVESKARHEGWDETGYWFLMYVDISDFNQPDHYKVIPETVGQYTGLKDKNGKEIYDSDKVKRRVHLVEGSDYTDYTCEVRWNGWCYGLCVADKQLWGLDPITARECEVVGNIYENPELLNKEKV